MVVCSDCVWCLWLIDNVDAPHPVTNKMANIAYALIIGGALGNLFDRLYHGFVVDFLDFYYGNYHWPAFNIADSAICLGAALLILDGFRAEKAAKAH